MVMKEYIKENRFLLSICAMLGIAIIIMGLMIGKFIDNRKILDANLKAATTEMEELRTKNGDLLVEKQSYVGTIKELEGIIGISKEEVKSLQKTLDDKILYISDLETQINMKPTEVHDTTVIYKDSSFVYSFAFGDEWYKLNGHSQVNQYNAKTWIDGFNLNIPLRVGLTDDWEIFVTTPNPYVSFNDIQGALLDKNVYLRQKKVRRFGLSVYGGMNIGYDLLGNRFYVGPGVGVGFSYILF